MAISDNLLARIKDIASSPTLCVVPVGNPDNPNRGILQVGGDEWSGLRRAVVQAFSAAVIAAALLAPQQAEARGAGYDADYYGQSSGQVMQQGSGISMEVLSTRPVKIELQPEPSDNTMNGAVTIAAGGLGAVLGNRIGGNGPNSRAAGTILGGLIGAAAGHYANKMMNEGAGPKTVDGTEITMIDPNTKRVAVVTQAGSQYFGEGDRVLMVNTGGSYRVIPDRGRSYERQQAPDRVVEAAPAHGPSQRNAVSEIVRTADTMGIQVDPAKVANMLETGTVPNQRYVGRVVGVDRELGLVYQELGKGAGTVHQMDSLSRVPAVGESISVSYKDGFGLVAARQASRSLEAGR